MQNIARAVYTTRESYIDSNTRKRTNKVLKVFLKVSISHSKKKLAIQNASIKQKRSKKVWKIVEYNTCCCLFLITDKKL